MLHWQTKLVTLGLLALTLAGLFAKAKPIGYFWT
jgi:hypothetical protein